MNDRPTPETDQFKIKLKTTCGEKYWVPVEHSERFERERDEARKGLDEIRAERDLARLSSMESDQAHDRMVGELEKVYQVRDKLNTDLVEISNKLVVAMRERDEAREECKEAQYESEQQSRLLGISAEREYALRGKIFELERKILQLEEK